MNRFRQSQSLLGAGLLALAALFLVQSAAWAQEGSSPQPALGPRLSPPAFAQGSAIDSNRIYNDLIRPALPLPAREADIDDDGRRQAAPGQGVRQDEHGSGQGLTLYAEADVCNSFNDPALWGSHRSPSAAIWSDSYAGWGVFAVDDGGFYRAANVALSLEQTVGPGDKFGTNQSAVKFAGSQPYAAGLGSPRIAVSPGTTVTVSVKYMIFDHDTSGKDFDWASLGVKADAARPGANYVNGYARGEWAELRNTVVSGDSGEIMILLQGQSPAAVNSNIYFDDVKIAVDGKYLADCTYAGGS